jgi:GTP-binding protein TypA/BipA
VEYDGTHINIVDTPGHADFGGEVERVLSMVDGVLLLVDAVEGPMPQTRFVTKKALALGLQPIVVVNKVDRPGARCDYVINATFELFDKLGATEEQLDFPVIYASGLNGYAGTDESVREGNMRPLFDAVLQHVPVRDDEVDAPLQLQISSIDYSSYVGKIGVGRISRGRIKPGTDVICINGPDGTPFKGRINQVLKFRGLEREVVDEAIAGDSTRLKSTSQSSQLRTLFQCVSKGALTHPEFGCSFLHFERLFKLIRSDRDGLTDAVFGLSRFDGISEDRIVFVEKRLHLRITLVQVIDLRLNRAEAIGMRFREI